MRLFLCKGAGPRELPDIIGLTAKSGLSNRPIYNDAFRAEKGDIDPEKPYESGAINE